MLKAERDRVLVELEEQERQDFRQFIDQYREARRSGDGQASARGMLEAMGAGLSDSLRQAMQVVVARDEMGPHAGDTPPDFELKRLGSDERVRLSSFKGQRPLAIVFGSYT